VTTRSSDGLLDQQRLVHEVRLGRQQGRLDPVAGEIAERQQCLQPGHAPASDQHPGLSE
jgi:hypothetical protein